jgi:hypothetical protein
MEVDDNSVLTRSTRDIMSMDQASSCALLDIMIVIIYTLNYLIKMT